MADSAYPNRNAEWQMLLRRCASRIAARLKTGENVIADRFSDVTVLFAEWISSASANGSVKLPCISDRFEVRRMDIETALSDLDPPD